MVKEYILSVDTETSGLPKNWNASYSKANNWPYNVQIAWVIFDKNGKEIKSENHYILAKDFNIDPESIKIHGITEEFLKVKGEERLEVFKLLSADLEKYKPLVVGHFMEFDNHMIELGFRRSGLENNSSVLPKFCTMKATKRYTRSLLDPHLLKLDELYKLLFNRQLDKHHDAFCDAKATGECFFEMIKRGDISEKDIQQQIKYDTKKNDRAYKKHNNKLKRVLFLFVGLIVLLLIIIMLFKL
jgi:DNA polymerase III subunit epsilon